MPGQFFNTIGKDTFSKTVEIKRSYKILLTTDKPLYQPGQTIHIRALALSTLDALPAANREVTIEVEDAKGNKVFKKKPVASPHGVVGLDFTLAHELNAGKKLAWHLTSLKSYQFTNFFYLKIGEKRGILFF